MPKNKSTETSSAPPPATPPASPPAPAVAAAPPTIESLSAELADAQKEVKSLLAAKAASDEEEALISQKTAIGLNRSQATAIIRRQREFDASPFGQAMRGKHEAAHGLRARHQAQTEFPAAAKA